MRLTISRKIRGLALTVVLGCVGVAMVNLWRVSSFRAAAPQSGLSTAASKQGIGSEVKLAANGASVDEAIAAVASVDSFIYRRSGLKMSDETKNKLAMAEAEALNGARQRISPDRLAALFADVATTRLANATDDEIEKAANRFAAPDDAMAVRAKGEWAFSSKTSFGEELREARESSRRLDHSTVGSLRAAVGQKIKERLGTLGDALPEKFQNADTQGLTPLQAVLLGYSVATDDTLDMSQGELRAQIVQEWSAANQPRNFDGSRRRETARAYGVGGAIKSSPYVFFFDKSAISQVLEGGIKK